MCGIAGIVSPSAEGHRGRLRQMVDSLRHRGPDGSGTHIFPGCGLGHARLSIVDLATGHQPMLCPKTPVGITFNGEIYGYKQIRASLEGVYPFRTTSDTEVILALYRTGGERWIEKVPGMFAFALWDETRQELVCARDRFGEKPFFYAFGKDGEFLFASEIKAILASGLVRPVLRRASVSHYLKHLYIHPRETIYENIQTLPPAHQLRCREGRVTIERYWTLPESRDGIGLDEAAGEFRRLFERAVDRQLVADVPVGAFLSGGLDSSTVVAVASRIKRGLHTYSFGFEEVASELPYAREVAGLWRTEHVELKDTGTDIGTALQKMVEVYDEPLADSSNIPTWLIARQACRYTKVVLTGDGGDELLAGYDFWYRPLFLMERETSSSAWRMALLRLAARIARKTGSTRSGAWDVRCKALSLRRRYGSVASAHAAQNIFFGDEDLADLGLPPVPGDALSLQARSHLGTVDDALRMDLENYMPGDILVKTDRASMAHGLELRAPFLDVDFATFCISLPSSLKITAERDKHILREVYAGDWPPSIRSRSKQGFGAPVNRWLKRDSVRDLKTRYLDDPGRKIFDLLPFDRTRKAAAADDYRTWILLVLSLWMDHRDFDLPKRN